MTDILLYTGIAVGVLIFAWLFDKFFGFIFGLFKKKEHTIGDLRDLIDKI